MKFNRTRLLIFAVFAAALGGAAAGCGTGAQKPVATATVVEAAYPPTPVPVVTPTYPPSPAAYLVGNTGGLGAFLRRSPQTGDKIKAWPDGTVMTVIGGEQVVDGHTWRNVKDPEGNEGWMRTDLLVPLPPTPTPTPTGTPLAKPTPMGAVAPGPALAPFGAAPAGAGPLDG